MRELLVIGFGGALGATTRYMIGVFLKNYKTSIPIATISVNLLGSFIFGILLASQLDNQHHIFYLLLTGGFLGSLTTFSTFSYETISLLRMNQLKPLFIYVLIHLIVGISIAALGFYLVQ